VERIHGGAAGMEKKGSSLISPLRSPAGFGTASLIIRLRTVYITSPPGKIVWKSVKTEGKSAKVHSRKEGESGSKRR
jgi:hypothetical protein